MADFEMQRKLCRTYDLPQRALAAFLAISPRFFLDRLAARALPPKLPSSAAERS